MQLSRNLGLQQLWVDSHTHYLTFIFQVFKSWCEDALTSEMGPVTCVCTDETMWHFFLDDKKSNLSTCLTSITSPSTCCFHHPPSCPLCLTHSLTFRLYQDPTHPSSMLKTLRSVGDSHRPCGMAWISHASRQPCISLWFLTLSSLRQFLTILVLLLRTLAPGIHKQW